MRQKSVQRRPLAEPIGEPLPWLASLATHAVLLVVLGLITQLSPIDFPPELISPVPPQTDEPPEDAFRVADELSVDVGALSDAGAGDAAAAAPAPALLSEVSIEQTALARLGELPALEATAPLATSPDLLWDVEVRGVGAVGATGSQGAVDRLTGEILLSLEQRPTLVVWLFDRSGSLTDQREQIVERFDRVYEQLGVAAVRGAEGFDRDPADADDAPLLTTVAAYADTVQFLTRQPTDDVDAIKQAVRDVTPDAGGMENVFSAVIESVDRHKRYRLRRPRRNLMVVVFTDEAGDDTHLLDRAVDLCRTMQTPVYVVGAPAPFGRVENYVRYVDPDPQFDQSTQFLPVRQGPESLMPERLRLGYFGRGDVDGPTLDAGFGPFGLTRLAAESGGFYIAVHAFRVAAGRADKSRRRDHPFTAEIDYFFDERLMRRYRPDYVPTGEYQRRLRENGARRALVEAASLSWTEPLRENVRREFPKLDDAQFAQDLSVAQRAAAVLEPKLQQLVATLRRGEGDRPELDSPRWQAGYDLAMGRALATKVRAEGYNTMLALAKQGMEFTSERKDTWVLAPSDEILTGSRAEAEAGEARAYLERVAAEHKGTPWALLAERELDRPLGWEWRDEFRNLAERLAQQQNNRPNRPQPNPPAAKPTRPPPKL
ncbi:vWA domain-containing protein [Botrimarina sp.]|uniref:vWA domain-containing protein n=1 Tax=Botrimarina sp. TaxID=2795802 RepID=UPI0032ED58B0